MNCSKNSHFFSIHKPLGYLSTSSQPHHCPQACPLEQAGLYSSSSTTTTTTCSLCPFCFCHNGIEIQRSGLFHPNGLLINQERRVLAAYMTKVARTKRKLARQRSLNKNPSFSPNSTLLDSKRLNFNGVKNSQSSINRGLYNFCTPDNRKLKLLLRKELRNSDVGSLGRIVLPKREAEENLPILSDKDGIQVVIKDVYSNKEWSLKFKYWSNNKSRMYVLENTGDFVKQNGLEIGDFLTLYEDESKNLYFSVKKVEIAVPEQSSKPQSTNQNYMCIPYQCQARDEEEASLALLIEQLKHKEQQDLVTLSMDIGPYNRHKEEEKDSTTFNNFTSMISIYPQPVMALQPSSSMRIMDDHFVDDCYTGLDLLPDVNI